jgi:hypothetical protein
MDSNDTKTVFLIVGTMLIGVIIFIGLIVGADYFWVKNVTCPAFGQSVERPIKFDYFAGGCFVEAPNGQWVHTSNYWSSPPQ